MEVTDYIVLLYLLKKYGIDVTKDPERVLRIENWVWDLVFKEFKLDEQ